MHILVKCCFCIGCFHITTMEYNGEGFYTLRYRDIYCPHCKTRIVPGRQLKIILTDELMIDLQSANNELEKK